MSEISDGQISYYEAVTGEDSLTHDTWLVNPVKRHAFKVFSESSAIVSNKLVPEVATSSELTITKFSDKTLETERTKVVVNEDGTEKIELDLPDHIMTVLMDQSGSMTWNDNGGLRHTIARRLVQRVAATYPGNVSFNVIDFNGMPVNVTLFGVVENNVLEQNDIQSLSAAFFEDEEYNFAGIRVVRKEGSYPTSPIDGEIVQEGFFNKVADIDLTEGVKYYYTVFTFDKDFHFSNGVNIEATPRERQIPNGIAKITSSILNGSGFRRDANTSALWHLDEGKSTSAYDFSDSRCNLVFSTETPIWLSSDEVPVGTSGLRFNGVDEWLKSSEFSPIVQSGDFTAMAWIYPYDLSSNRAIVSRSANSSLNYVFYQNSSGGLSFSNGSVASSSAGVLVAKRWNHVAVSISGTTATFYVDGVSVGTGSVSASPNTNASMYSVIGEDLSGSVNPYFGKITEVNIHTIARTSTEIGLASEMQSIELNPNVTIASSNDSFDNGDRLVIFSYEIPNDLNYESIRVVRKMGEDPTWEMDGAIEDIVASPGKHIYTDAYDFACGKSYRYRFFTNNSTGNYSYLNDSPIINAEIPVFTNVSSLPDLVTPIYPVVDATSQSANKKVYVKWSNPFLEDRFSVVELWYSATNFPIISDDGETGEILFTGEIEDESFVHRGLKNYEPAYYTIVVKDKYGRSSSIVNVSAIPEPGLSELGIPLTDVKSIRYDLIDNSSLSVSWDPPVKFTSNLTGFFDQRVVLYGSITDEFGKPISDQTFVTLKITPKLTYRSQSENVFTDSEESEIVDNDLYSFGVTRSSNGIIKGSLSMSSNPELLSRLTDAKFDVQVYSYVPDPNNPSAKIFEFYSVPVTIDLKNPWQVSLTNRDARYVSVKCPVPLDGISLSATLSNSEIAYEEKEFPGAYVRSTYPFVVRVNLSFRDEPLTSDSTIRVSVWDATSNTCSASFEPEKIKPSTTVLPPATTLRVQTGQVEEIDAEGQPTGNLRNISYVDVPMTVPRQPQAAILFVQAKYAGYETNQKMYFLLENIMKVELTARAPSSDGIDVAEQQASIYLIDPDFPDDETKRVPVPDLTVTRWSLSKDEFGQDRPFYSTDTIPTLSGGVYSYVRSGLAKNVFFGPASGVQWHYVFNEDTKEVDVIGERYTVSVNAVYDGLSASSKQQIEIYPLDGKKSRFGSKFLMEFPTFKNVLWADGEDYQKLVISRSANNPSVLSNFGQCFQECAAQDGADLIDMTPGQIVFVNTDSSFEILWGDIREEYDPYDGKVELVKGENGYSSQGFAQVEIEDADETIVYFRINGFFPPPADSCKSKSENEGNAFGGEERFLNACECLGIKKDEPALQDQCREFVVGGSTTILVNQEPRGLSSGGTLQNGIPPTILVPREPLNIRVVGILVNGTPSDTFVLDGVSENEVVVEVSFADKTVPDGTPVNVELLTELQGGISLLDLEQRTIFTESSINEFFDSLRVRSYATLNIRPLTAQSGLNETIVFTTNFDKSGTVSRVKKACLNIEWNPADQTSDEIGSLFDSKLYSYDVTNNVWSSTLTPMTHARSAINLEAYSGKLYAIGGIDSKTISRITEQYDLATDLWEDISPMPTARFAAQSAIIGNKIYVIGGVTSNDDGSSLSVSRAVEVYDIGTGDWSVLADMPVVDDGSVGGKAFGICFGSAKYVSVSGQDRIYIIGGVREMDVNGNPTTYNDRILYYVPATNSWVALDSFTDYDLQIYARISPSVFVDGTDIVCIGGSVLKGKSLEFVTDTFVFDTVTEDIEVNDFDFVKLPRPRYRAGVVSIGSNHYILGGSNNKSQTLNYFDLVSTSGSPFSTTSIAASPVPITNVSLATATIPAAPYSSNSFIFAAGGFTSGRPEGFLQIKSSYGPNKVRLDGKQTCAISVELSDQNGESPSTEVTLLVRGYLKFRNSLTGKISSGVTSEEAEAAQSNASQKTAATSVDSRLAIYPVLFSSREITTVDGKALITMAGRSDDILQKIEDLAEKARADAAIINEVDISEIPQNSTVVINSGVVREPYDILVQITVVDDFYFGQTLEVIEDSGQPEATEETVTEPGNNPVVTDNTSNLLGTAVCSSVGTSLSWQNFSLGIDISNLGAVSSSSGNFSDEGSVSTFSLIPETLGQLNSPLIPYFIDIDWVPSVNVLLGGNEGTAEEALDVLRNLENQVAFGGSALFDALVKTAGIISDNDFVSYAKSIYTFTDNESNMSIFTLNEAIDEINAVSGLGKTPVVIGNFSVVSPITLSAKANITDTNDLNLLATKTGGQSITVLTPDFVDDTVGIFAGEATGSLGYGESKFTVDLGQIAEIKDIVANFDLFENTNARWKLEYSSDGYTYTVLSENYKANLTIDFDNLNARYLRFTAIMITGFTASNDPEYELVPLPASPSLSSFVIGYETPKESFLYLNTKETNASVQQVVIAVDANKVDANDIQVGVSESASHNWNDYQTPVKPHRSQNGKDFVPIRFVDENEDGVVETLEKIDKFSFRAKFSRWNNESVVTVLNDKNEEIDSSEYAIYPRDGLVVFNKRQVGEYKIQIRNGNSFRVGLRLLNRSAGNPMEISGVGFMYNTNVQLLPPAEKANPQAGNVVILPDSPDRYSAISASFEYSDANGDPEDLAQREIRWYINGVRIPYLDNLVKWNDVTNVNDPLYSHAFTFDPASVPATTTVASFARSKNESILKAGDQVYFTVRVGDGTLLSSKVSSNIVTVLEKAPEVGSIAIRGLTAAGTITDKVTSATDAVVQFEFVADSSVNNSTITWTVNGDVWKTGVIGTDENADRILAGEQNSRSQIALLINNEIGVSVTPSTSASDGITITGDSIIVKNAIPAVTNVTVAPRNPRAGQNLVLSFTFQDNDLLVGDDGTQSNQSTVKWYKANRASGYTYSEMVEFENVSIVPPSATSIGDRWKAVVTPFDGLDLGLAVESNVVVIG